MCWCGVDELWRQWLDRWEVEKKGWFWCFVFCICSRSVSVCVSVSVRSMTEYANFSLLYSVAVCVSHCRAFPFWVSRFPCSLCLVCNFFFFFFILTRKKRSTNWLAARAAAVVVVWWSQCRRRRLFRQPVHTTWGLSIRRFLFRRALFFYCRGSCWLHHHHHHHHQQSCCITDWLNPLNWLPVDDSVAVCCIHHLQRNITLWPLSMYTHCHYHTNGNCSWWWMEQSRANERDRESYDRSIEDRLLCTPSSWTVCLLCLHYCHSLDEVDREWFVVNCCGEEPPRGASFQFSHVFLMASLALKVCSFFFFSSFFSSGCLTVSVVVSALLCSHSLVCLTFFMAVWIFFFV